MILGVFIGLLILIFPIFITFRGIFSIENKDIFLNVYIFNTIKVTSIRIYILNYKIIVKVGNKRVFRLPIKSILNFRSKIEGLKDYHIVEFNNEINIFTKNIIQTINISQIINLIFNRFGEYMKFKKNYLSLSNVINVNNESGSFFDFFEMSFVFNLLTFLISIIKIVGGKILYAIRKQQN